MVKSTCKSITVDHDELQWILRRGQHPIAFVSSTKTILIRCLIEAGLEPDEAARATAGLHSTFREWKAAQFLFIAAKGRPIISMRRALADPRFFGALLSMNLRDKSWDNWAVVLTAAFPDAAEPLSKPERKIFIKLTGRSRLLRRPPRRMALRVGRRGGKDAALRASVYTAGLSGCVGGQKITKVAQSENEKPEESRSFQSPLKLPARTVVLYLASPGGRRFQPHGTPYRLS